jgi:hypothetical protein
MTDKTVHAKLSGGDLIVRRDRAGKWYRESEGRLFPISFDLAIDLARKPGSEVYLGMPGGKMFDFRMRP